MTWDRANGAGSGLRPVMMAIGMFAGSAFVCSAPSSTAGAQVVVIRVDPLPSQTRELRPLRSFPTEREEAGGIYLSQAQYLSSDPQGRILVTDVGTCEVFVFDPEGRLLRRIGRRGQGPGDLSVPGRALFIGGRWAVLDRGNARVQYFDESGRCARSIRLPRGYADMALAGDGTFYGVPLPGQPGPVIDVLGVNGEPRFSFGEPPETVLGGQAPSQPRISMSPRGELFVAYWFAPVVQVYAAAGELKKVFRIQYRPMLDKLRRNPSGKMALPGGGRPVGESIIEAIQATDSGFYILHRDPGGRADILEFDRDGAFVRDYWCRPSGEYYPMDLTVRKDAGRELFYLLQVSPENRVDVFVGK